MITPEKWFWRLFGECAPRFQCGPGAALRQVIPRRRALAGHPTLALAGAALDGVGVPACVRSGRAAGAQVADALRQGAEWSP